MMRPAQRGKLLSPISKDLLAGSCDCNGLAEEEAARGTPDPVNHKVAASAPTNRHIIFAISMQGYQQEKPCNVTVCPPHIIRWVSLHVIPQERKVRAVLRRSGAAETDIDDLIQDAYCRLASLKSVDHIDRPGAYFMQIVKNAWRDALRRARVVRFEDFTENASVIVEDQTTGVEATVLAREQLGLIEALLATLPERCRTIFIWRRMEGIPQREIARRLGVSENVVENDVQKALRVIQRALRSPEEEQEEQTIDGQQRKAG